MTSRDPFKSYIWKSDIFSCDSNDIDTFYACLNEQVSRLGLLERKLGEAGNYPINFYQSPTQKTLRPSLLISAGFHGSEPAGPWGMLHFLNELKPELFDHINLSLLPLVNPTGFKRGHRFNQSGENPNRGFVLDNDRAKSNGDTSAEGKALLEHSKLLQAASKDGILSCHEDVQQKGAYIYSFESNQNPSQFSKTLRDTLGQYFSIAQDGKIDGCTVKDGIIFNQFDHSFEAFLVNLGANVGVCSETPGKQNIDQRIIANSAIMQSFIEQVIARP